MTTTKRPGDLKDIQEAVAYIRAYLNERGKRPDEDVAGSIVGLGVNDLFEEWYKNKSLAIIYENACDLEWSNGDAETLEGFWNQIYTSLKRLDREIIGKVNRPHFKSPQEFVAAWRQIINKRQNKTSEAIAYEMVDIVLNSELFDEYYERDKDIACVFDEVSDLEWSNAPKDVIPQIWDEIEQLLKILERRYIPETDFKKPQEIVTIWRQIMDQRHTKISAELAFQMVNAVRASKLLEEYFNKDSNFAYVYRNISVLQDPDLDEGAQKIWSKIERRLTVLEDRYKD